MASPRHSEVMNLLIFSKFLGADCYKQFYYCRPWASDSFMAYPHPMPLPGTMRKSFFHMSSCVLEMNVPDCVNYTGNVNFLTRDLGISHRGIMKEERMSFPLECHMRRHLRPEGGIRTFGKVLHNLWACSSLKFPAFQDSWDETQFSYVGKFLGRNVIPLWFPLGTPSLVKCPGYQPEGDNVSSALSFRN